MLKTILAHVANAPPNELNRLHATVSTSDGNTKDKAIVLLAIENRLNHEQLKQAIVVTADFDNNDIETNFN